MKYNAGLTATLPAFVINDVKVRENNEPLVDIKKSDCTLFFGDKLKNEKSVFLRESVANKIKSIAQSLPQGVCLIIYDAYRSWQKQTEFMITYPAPICLHPCHQRVTGYAILFNLSCLFICVIIGVNKQRR